MKITKTLRVFLILLSVMMVLPLFACGDTPEETTTKAPEQTTAPKEETTTDKKVETTEPKADATTAEPEAPATTVAPEETTEAETTSAETTEATTESGSETTETGSESSETAETETTEVETTETTAAPECDHVEEEIPAVAPTCEETGLTAGKKCSVCGEILVAQNTVAALGHKWDDGVVTTEPTCEGKGVKAFTCQNDSTHTKTEDVDALGHKWDDGVVTTEPNCEDKGVKAFTCQNDFTHTKTEEIPANGHGEGVKDVEDNCNVKCPVCQKVLEEGQHDPAKKATAWTHVIGTPDENGKLYEALLCGDCGKPAETRELYYINCCDGIYVDGVVVNPSANNPKQTTGFGTKYSDCSVIDGEDFVGKNGGKIVVFDDIKFSGWLVMNGGVKEYGVFIDDGEGEPTWYAMTGAGDVGEENGIYTTVIAVKNEITDKAGAKIKANYQGKMAVSGLAEYAGKTVNITFGAVPAGNPGEEGNPNIVTIAKLTNVEINGVEKIGTTSKAIAPFTATVAEGDADGVTYYWKAVAPGDLILTFPTVEGVSYSYKVFTNANPGVVYTEEDAVDGKVAIKVAKDNKIYIQIVTDEAKALEAEIGLTVDCYAYGADVPAQALTNLTQSRDDEGNLVITAKGKNIADAHFTFFGDNDIDIPGRYIIITYKTTTTNIGAVHLQAHSEPGMSTGWKNFGSIKTVKDGEWHTAVIDLVSNYGSAIPTYYFRLDVCETIDGDASITFKGFKFVDDLAAANRELGGPLWSYSGEEIDVIGNPTRLTKDADGDGKTDRDADGNLILSSTEKGDSYATVLGGTCAARYIAITVKASDSDSILGSIFVTPRGENINDKYTTGAPVVDHIGEWVTVIIDVRNYNTKVADSEAITALRIDCCDNGGTMTIKSIEGFGDLDMAVASAGENVVLGVGVTLPTQE